MDIFKVLTGGARFKAPQISPISPPLDQNIRNLDLFNDSNLDKSTGIITLEAAKLARKNNQIRVYGDDIPFPFSSFTQLMDRFKMKRFLRIAIDEAMYVKPTPIQMQAIPIMLHQRDLIACAPTGSGKTLAFLLGMIHYLKNPSKEGFRSLIIAPTRELCQQIYRELKKLTKNKPFKIVLLSKATNSESLKINDILISTPLRLVGALQNGNLKLDNVKHLILDEADKLLELGFLEQMDEIFSSCSNNHIQKSLFSATIPSGVEELAKSIMKDPIQVVIGRKNAATSLIEQKLLFVGQESGKLVAIRQLIHEGFKPPVLIFVQSIARAQELFNELIYDGINVDMIHSERSQLQRDNIVSNFRIGKIWVLISTELISRGIDFKNIQLVINYDFPQTAASYIHRIGRTGRCNQPGKAITYFTKDDSIYLKSVVNVMKESGCEIPSWMLKLKKPSKNQKKNFKSMPINREDIKTVSKYDENKKKKKDDMVQASKRRKLALVIKDNPV